MADNLSVFPEQIDTFITHFDINPANIPNLGRYQELRIKDTLSSAESEEMERLFSALRQYIWLAEDLNKIQDCMTNLETFFKYKVEIYIDEKYSAWETLTNNKIVEVDNKITEIDNKVDEVQGWLDTQTALIHDSTYFDFDNMCYRNGFKLKTKKDGDNWLETLMAVADNSVYATRETIKNGDSDFTVITLCDKVVPPVATNEHWYKDGLEEWTCDITNVV